MCWLGINDLERGCSDLSGLGQALRAEGGGDALMLRGTLVAEMSIPDCHRPEPLLQFAQDGDWPINLGIQVLPGGGVSLVLHHSGSLAHAALNPSGAGRTGQVRLTYAWDSLAGYARLALECADSDRVQMALLPPPRPWRYQDLKTLFSPGPLRFTSVALTSLAVSNALEPVGLMPGLDPATPVATPQGYRLVETLQRGDLVLSETGASLPILHVLHREVPAMGMFRPVALRPPFFGLQQAIQVSASQRLVLSGSEVEYLFGRPAVLVPARHLMGTSVATPVATQRQAKGLTTRYTQLVLPDHAPLLAAGAVLESLYLGSLRRDATRLNASQLAGVDRSTLPEQGSPRYPVLGAFDAAVLAERRVA
ncbi:Hint domain-containing protein [Pseudophaeobacter arcticus]|uniref:Hint domain-containing protein n=1 Tax=Pseudophaeobacter arcticus TaxID=385492 RepID=UPI0024911806|nr:Hint domain-containing protein [Pseudophaeobacter arcticus]